jgi:hypothetical protein
VPRPLWTIDAALLLSATVDADLSLDDRFDGNAGDSCRWKDTGCHGSISKFEELSSASNTWMASPASVRR